MRFHITLEHRAWLFVLLTADETEGLICSRLTVCHMNALKSFVLYLFHSGVHLSIISHFICAEMIKYIYAQSWEHGRQLGEDGSDAQTPPAVKCGGYGECECSDPFGDCS